MPAARRVAKELGIDLSTVTGTGPDGAITEKDQIDQVWAALDDPSKTVVVQTAPAIRAALGECFDYPPGTLVTGKMSPPCGRLASRPSSTPTSRPTSPSWRKATSC